MDWEQETTEMQARDHGAKRIAEFVGRFREISERLAQGCNGINFEDTITPLWKRARNEAERLNDQDNFSRAERDRITTWFETNLKRAIRCEREIPLLFEEVQAFAKFQKDESKQEVVDEIVAAQWANVREETRALIYQDDYGPERRRDLVSKFNTRLLSAVTRERQFGRLKPWRRIDEEKRCESHFSAHGVNSFERQLICQLLPEGDQFVRIDFDEFETSSGRIIKRDDIDRLKSPNVSRASWERSKTPPRVIDELKRNAAAERAARERPANYGTWNFND